MTRCLALSGATRSDPRHLSADVPDFAERLCAEYDRAREVESIGATFAAWQDGGVIQARLPST